MIAREVRILTRNARMSLFLVAPMQCSGGATTLDSSLGDVPGLHMQRMVTLSGRLLALSWLSESREHFT